MTTIAELEVENGRLMLENEMLRDALLGRESVAIPAEWKLTPMERKMFLLLAGPAQVVTRVSMLNFIYAEGEWPESNKVADVRIFNIRRKVRKFGVKIETVYGRGWRLDAETKKSTRLGPEELCAMGRIGRGEAVRRILAEEQSRD